MQGGAHTAHRDPRDLASPFLPSRNCVRTRAPGVEETPGRETGVRLEPSAEASAVGWSNEEILVDVEASCLPPTPLRKQSIYEKYSSLKCILIAF